MPGTWSLNLQIDNSIWMYTQYGPQTSLVTYTNSNVVRGKLQICRAHEVNGHEKGDFAKMKKNVAARNVN